MTALIDIPPLLLYNTFQHSKAKEGFSHMIGLGTIVNCGAIIAGTTLGVLLKGGLPRCV